MSTTTLAAQNNFLIPNATFLVEMVAFFVILGVLWRYVVPPIQRATSERQETIKTQFEEARAATERAETAEAEYKASLARARVQAARIREEARTQGRRIIDEMRAKAQSEADRELQHGRQHLTSERDALVRELREETGDLAVDLAGRIVGESLAGEARVARSVEQFLAETGPPSSGAPRAEEPASARAGESA